MLDRDIDKVIRILKKETAHWDLPIVTSLAEQKNDPFRILISTVLSSRTTDEVTAEASRRLFSLAFTPEEMLRLSEDDIIRAIYPVGFYRTKSKAILDICRNLVDRFHSQVPDTMEELLTLRGVGRKTANLVLALGFGGKGICVDTHVHRISNRLGYVRTKTPRETEDALRAKLPGKYWAVYNTIMVAHGRHICRPVSPFCSKCPVFQYCDRAGVTTSR
ncbi:MAG: endonuclease III [Syntrophales bacterium]